MYELKKMESYLSVKFLGMSPHLIKKLLGCGLTKVEKHCAKWYVVLTQILH